MKAEEILLAIRGFSWNEEEVDEAIAELELMKKSNECDMLENTVDSLEAQLKDKDIAIELLDKLHKAYAEAEYECKAKDEKLKQLDEAYSKVASDFESAVMKLAKKDKEIEKLKKQYHQCLDDYNKM